MPNFYDIDFDQQAQDLIPPDKRTPATIAYTRAHLKPVQWCRDKILGSYKSGSNSPIWSPGVYNKYDQVIFKKQVFSSLVNNNTVDPTNAGSWELILTDFIGVDERIKFNGRKIVLEYALNKRFSGVFRLPITMTHSDIYITKLPPTVFGFLVGQTKGSTVGQTTSSDAIGWPLPFKRINNFQINVLASIYAMTNETEIREFADKYVAAGLRYTVVSY